MSQTGLALEDELNVSDIDGNLVAKLRRTCLRVIQNQGPIIRTNLTVQVRPHSEHWDIVLDDLVDRGLIHREAVIRDNNRAAVSYRLGDAFGPGGRPVPSFADMTPEEVDQYVLEWEIPGADALPSAASA